MVANLQGSVGARTKEYDPTQRVWAAGFHHVTARSRLPRVLKHMKRYFFSFPFFRAAVNRGLLGSAYIYRLGFRDFTE
jgi:hypothetical protein